MDTTQIQNKILEVRGKRVMLDFDLARLYETEAKRLKEAVRRNADRFPPDFMFQLTKEEWDILRTQFASLKIGSGKQPKYLPFAFTEHGVAMLASVLSSPKAVQVNIVIVRAFIALREYAMNYKELAKKIEDLERKYNRQFNDVYEVLDFLTQLKKLEKTQKERIRIGFKK